MWFEIFNWVIRYPADIAAEIRFTVKFLNIQTPKKK